MYAVEYINQNLNPRKVLDYYNFEGITENDEYIRAKCKIHGGDNPTAFCWNKANNLWFCYTGSCGGGDVFTLVEKMEKCGFTDATIRVAQILGLDIGGMEVVSEDKLRIKHLRWLEKELKKHKCNNKASATIQPYEVPYTKYSLEHEIFDRFEPSLLEKYEAKFCNVYPTENGMLYNKLVIPLYQKETIVGCALRDTTGKGIPKWYYVPKGLSVSSILYNYDYIEKNEDITEVILVEGIFDVWAYHKVGIDNVVAIFGSSLSDEQADLLIRLSVDVTLSFDNDTAGNKATAKAIKLLKNKVTLKKIELAEGNDPADMSSEELLKAYLKRSSVL